MRKGKAIFVLLLAIEGVPVCLGQQETPQADDEVRTRELWNTEFRRRRSSPKQDTARPPAAPAPSFVGVTVWRLRRSRPADAPGVRLLVHDADRSTEFTPERVDSDTLLAEGDRVRLSIECGQPGYLYVVEREKYADGTLGDPYLIFPTQRLRGGDNRVSAASVVEIPGWDDHPPYLSVRRSRSDHVGEHLSLFVAPKLIEGIVPRGSAVRLAPEQVSEWERSAVTRAQSLALRSAAGRRMSDVERKAAAGTSVLSAGDPVPQTLYRVEAPPDAPLLISVDLLLALRR